MFAIMKPTWEEWSNADPEDIIEISSEDWNPQEHHDDLLTLAPQVNSAFNTSTKEEHFANALVKDKNTIEPEFHDAVPDLDDEDEIFYDAMQNRTRL